MAWFRKPKYTIFSSKKKDMPDGLWTKCESCSEIIYNKQLEDNLRVCPKCGFHFQVNAAERIAMLADPGTFVEEHKNITSLDPLSFKDSRPYTERIENAMAETGLNEACIAGWAEFEGIKASAAVLDFRFMGGSMASAVGEKVCRAIEKSAEEKIPLIIVSASGGARMQEGILSLMQMSKTSAALSMQSKTGCPYISILTNPTTGGVSASFAFLGDVIIAEPGALIGFAGPRVIKQTIHQELPRGFQTSEFLLEHGMIDLISPRRELRETTCRLLRLLTGKNEHTLRS
jgi:acetyl-CoA carboxylase carboxyl transferase subunit beta